ncbi:glycosyltransferase [Microvirga puerhi]|uniref:Glycosyltransferase n=1 Tax=Microvirga puerhi TaxID=2876078 RepID=A0ABS7VL79_9HYPH|nr:glycosyltransferase [Microvirga puerhi]MBZ6076294.1 glycosyltransferase [Microvirga puerhi]
MDLASLKPVVGYRPGRGRERLLMICFYNPSGIPTIYENIASWQAFSRYQIEIVNLWPGRGGKPLHLLPSLDLNQYAGIIIHSTVSYFPGNLFALDQELTTPFEEFDGVKILMKQDEQVQTRRFAEYIALKKIDLVVTCLPPEEWEKAYPRELVGDVDFLQAYTGYISPALRNVKRIPVEGRAIDVSYRGSIQPLEFGRLGYEKRAIGNDFLATSNNSSQLKLDISSRWEDRINGTAWFEFLRSSKVVLGVESGSNLFDFTGEVASWCRSYEERNQDMDPGSKAYYIKAHEEYLHAFEGNVNYAQISPRHFEAAVCQAAQILYEGHYSGIFIPYRHFLPLKRDMSNFAEAVDFARDERRLKEFAERTYEEVVLNPAYHYERFVEQFDAAVEQRMRIKNMGHGKTASATGQKARPKALLLMAHEPSLDPRIDWFSEGLSHDFDVCEIGIYKHDVENTAPTLERLSDHRVRVRIEREPSIWDTIVTSGGLEQENSVGIQALQYLYLLEQLPAALLARTIGAHDADEDDLYRFRWYCRYFVTRNAALIRAARLVDSFDLIATVDLDTLPAAAVLAKELGVPVVYDAHEYWPHSNPSFRHWEIDFWTKLESELLSETTYRLTVSPQLATEMSGEYGRSFTHIPNCASLGIESSIDLERVLRERAGKEEVVFLFQGNFSPHRGVENLVEMWSEVDPRATLWLRGPDSDIKAAAIEIARNKGTLNRTVFFPDAVPEAELVMAAREADVGLIPYEPFNLNYRYSSPNKLSQYLAAGLPIICNEIDFVRSVVVNNGVGTAVNFRERDNFIRTINAYVTDRPRIAELSRKAQVFFTECFNWQVQSRDVYAAVKALVPEEAVRQRALDFDWISDQRKWNAEPSTQEARIATLEADLRRYTAEIQRLHTDYPEHIRMLNSLVRDVSLFTLIKYRVVLATKIAVKRWISYPAAWPLKVVVEAGLRYRRRRQEN